MIQSLSLWFFVTFKLMFIIDFSLFQSCHNFLQSNISDDAIIFDQLKLWYSTKMDKDSGQHKVNPSPPTALHEKISFRYIHCFDTTITLAKQRSIFWQWRFSAFGLNCPIKQMEVHIPSRLLYDVNCVNLLFTSWSLSPWKRSRVVKSSLLV